MVEASTMKLLRFFLLIFTMNGKLVNALVNVIIYITLKIFLTTVLAQFNLEDIELEEDDVTESHAHPHGEPLNIMQFTKNGSVTVDYEGIEKMFLHPEVKNRKIVAISIIGAFRKGKSFFMDYCLRFMYANVSKF